MSLVIFMKILICFIIFLLLPLVNATDYKQEFYLQDKETNVVINIDYKQEQDFNFYLDLPKDVKEIKVYFDEQEKQFKIKETELNNFVNIFGTAVKIKIKYNSESYIEKSSKNYFTAEVIPLIDGNLEINIILPEGAVLDKPYTDKGSSSIYPKPNSLETNGKNMIIIWKDEAKSYDPFSLFIVYNYSRFNYYILIMLILFIAVIYLIFNTRKKKEKKLKNKKIKKDSIEKHLKDEEKLVVSILKKKKGECTQSTLVTLTNMSKASLSRLLQELEQRNIIRKEQKGNKNLIILKRR